MTQRMQDYRERMQQKGLVQVRVWVEKQDEEFVKFIAKFCRGEQKEKKQKPRYGRPATEQQITLAKKFATANDVPEPKHLYDYHISLAAWIWRLGGGGFKDNKDE